VARPDSEIPFSAEISLFVSPVYVSGHCPTHTKKPSQPCPVEKLKSSFPTELGSVHPEKLLPCTRAWARGRRGHRPAGSFFPRDPNRSLSLSLSLSLSRLSSHLHDHHRRPWPTPYLLSPAQVSLAGSAARPPSPTGACSPAAAAPRAGGGARARVGSHRSRCAGHALTGEAGVAPRLRHGGMRARPGRRAWRRFPSPATARLAGGGTGARAESHRTAAGLGDGGWPGRRHCWRLAWATAASPLAGAGRLAGRRATPGTRLLLYFLLRTRLLLNFLLRTRLFLIFLFRD
jgi:hypothetical protein